MVGDSVTQAGCRRVVRLGEVDEETIMEKCLPTNRGGGAVMHLAAEWKTKRRGRAA